MVANPVKVMPIDINSRSRVPELAEKLAAGLRSDDPGIRKQTGALIAENLPSFSENVLMHVDPRKSKHGEFVRFTTGYLAAQNYEDLERLIVQHNAMESKR